MECSVECRVESVVCGVWNVKCRVWWRVGCRVWSVVECGV